MLLVFDYLLRREVDCWQSIQVADAPAPNPLCRQTSFLKVCNRPLTNSGGQ